MSPYISDRRSFLKLLLAGTGALSLDLRREKGLNKPVSSNTSDQLHPIPLENVHLSGYVGEKIDLCIKNRIEAQDIDRLVRPFAERKETQCWTSEFWGKWFTSAVDACRYSEREQLKQKVDNAVQALLATRTPDGYIGSYNEENRLSTWDVWGRKYTLLGLISYYDLTSDDKALTAARDLVDHLMTEVGPGRRSIVKTGAYRGMPSSSILEPIVLLYNRTNEKRYLDYAAYIVNEWTIPGGPDLIGKALAGIPVAERFPQPEQWWSWENGHKAYEMMSCYEGLVELYRVTGDESYLSAAVKAVENILETEINITGSGASLECWYGGKSRQVEPARHMMETCVTMTWMKLCFNLYRLTGDPGYVDEIERSGYNALLGAMTVNGDSFAKYSPLTGFRQLGEDQCDMRSNCCTANGPRGIMLFPQIAVMRDADGPVINLYIPGQAAVPLPSGNEINFRQHTDYPVSGNITIDVGPKRPENFTLSMRIPAWSSESTISVNGETAAPFTAGQYARISRTWKAGDQVTLHLDLRGRLVRSPGNRNVHTAIVRGPIVLARDSRIDLGDVDEVASPLSDENGFVELEPVRTGIPDDIWMAFRTRFDDGEHDEQGDLILCDYVSAGNTWDKNSRYRVWIPERFDPSRDA